MTRNDIGRLSGAAVLGGGLILAACAGATQPQGGPGGGMMGGGYGSGWMGGYGWPWMIILVLAIAGFVAWIVTRGRNKN